MKLTLSILLTVADFTVSTAINATEPTTTKTSNPIAHLVADLSSSHGLWINGIDQVVNLPKTASIEQVIEQVFQTARLEKGWVTSYTILKIRQVHIQVSTPDLYTAVLVRTTLGKKAVLLRYQERFGSWWYRVYDANRTYYEKISA